jgi:uncharacterized protein HemX
MLDPSGPSSSIGASAGEVGGVFAGIVALVVALGHGLRWWLGWTDRRAATRAAKLDAWQKQLEARETRLDAQQQEHWAEIGRELEVLRREHAALLGGYQLIATALRMVDPNSDALRRADELLRSAFLIDPLTPPDMTALLRRAHRPGDPA